MILSSQRGRSQEWKKTNTKKRKPELRTLAYLQMTGGSPQVYDWQGGKRMEQSSAAARGVFEQEGACTHKEPKVYSLPRTRFSSNQSPLSVYDFLVMKPGVWVCAITCLTDINLICRSLMFNQRRVVLLVGAKGPYRRIYGTAGTFKATVTVQVNLCMGREEEEGRRFMDGRWSAPTIIYRSEGGREDQAQAARQRFCTDSRERAKEAVINT